MRYSNKALYTKTVRYLISGALTERLHSYSEHPLTGTTNFFSLTRILTPHPVAPLVDNKTKTIKEGWRRGDKVSFLQSWRLAESNPRQKKISAGEHSLIPGVGEGAQETNPITALLHRTNRHRALSWAPSWDWHFTVFYSRESHSSAATVAHQPKVLRMTCKMLVNVTS